MVGQRRAARAAAAGEAPGDDGLPARRGPGMVGTVLRDRRFWVGAVIAGTVVTLALLAPLLAPYDPNAQFREGLPANGSPAGPSPGFLLGRDVGGRDVLSMLLWGARASLVVGLAASVAAATIGLLVALVAIQAGSPVLRLGGRGIRVPVESLLLRLTDLALAFPALLLALALTATVERSVGITIVVITLALWASVTRIAYTRARSVRQAPYLEAARALGSSSRFVLRRHYLPQVLPLVIGLAALGVGTALVFEATLSFLGVGVPADVPSWGRMISQALSWYTADPRLLMLPGAAVVLTVLGFGLVGEAITDASDPRRRTR